MHQIHRSTKPCRHNAVNMISKSADYLIRRNNGVPGCLYQQEPANWSNRRPNVDTWREAEAEKVGTFRSRRGGDSGGARVRSGNGNGAQLQVLKRISSRRHVWFAFFHQNTGSRREIRFYRFEREGSPAGNSFFCTDIRKRKTKRTKLKQTLQIQGTIWIRGKLWQGMKSHQSQSNWIQMNRPASAAVSLDPSLWRPRIPAQTPAWNLSDNRRWIFTVEMQIESICTIHVC